MSKLVYCYHSHTKRCGHANGEDEEYVINAIKAGIKRMGFSDHIFFPNGYEQPGIRGRFDQLDDYLKSVKYLKEKYKDQIDISVGFEAEHCAKFLGFYKDLLANCIDYLILGQHCYEQDGDLHWYFYQDCPIDCISKYVDDVIAGIKSGLFKYLAHPDLFMSSQREWNADLERESRRLLMACEEYHMPVEMNICGMRRRNYNEVNYSYPNINFYKLLKDYDLHIVMGVDAHDPIHYLDDGVNRAIDFAKRAGFEIDWDYKLK